MPTGGSWAAAMPMAVEISPFIMPCPDDERRFAECGDGTLVGDLIKELAKLLEMDPQCLSMIKTFEEGSTLVLHNKEPVSERLMVRGVRSLAGVPSKIDVAGKIPTPTSFSKEMALQIQEDTIQHYTSELVQLQLKALQDECQEEWKYLPQIDNVTMRDYMGGLRKILLPQQAKFFPKYGFEPTSKDMAIMQSIFNAMQDDQEIQDNTNKINAIIGTDYSWLPKELTAKQTFSAPDRGRAPVAGLEEAEQEAAGQVTAGSFEVETQE
eukprot:CAMPEP_0179143196 /NCGR_PEP_ID=MMETSP0796-20121207/68866_1 /TAXON_ID=73915 /ORGANISM="Pyrodinium bahamense, Strain pbaha01" /LENGTH=266 /DNA_ID=CAMNT_0020843221 /DNA_START=29 /DNA_END=829 /DNA_ORIENTATION=-